ncbi:hypothetical protein PCAR4_1090048 [Paraburkholderia caribensis]|nr:hypothetical protein PCAR4_1090048 [Paraburkholderia caribensis]
MVRRTFQRSALLSVAGGFGVGGQCVAALSERALHHRRVEPAAMLEADRLQRADQFEAGVTVQRQRAAASAVGDDGDHLAPRTLFASLDQRREQRASDAASAARIVDIDRIFDRKAIGDSRTIERRIRVARNLAVDNRHDIRQAMRQHGGAALPQIVDGRRRFFERRDACQHVVRVDGLDGVEVGVGGVADDGRGGRRGLAHCVGLRCRGWKPLTMPAARKEMKRVKNGDGEAIQEGEEIQERRLSRVCVHRGAVQFQPAHADATPGVPSRLQEQPCRPLPTPTSR